MGIKVQRPRCFFDIGISNVLVGRVVVELFADICPKTCENFRCLCTGEKGIGKGTQKPLHYKGCLFHRVVKDFMIQGGDFSEGNGRGGESIYGGFFEDESFAVKHNKEYLLSMANRGKDTNGSQFFITTKPSPHLDGVHVVFGHVISGQEVVQTMENQKTDHNSKPYAEVKVLNCGELVPKSKAKKDAKKKERASSSSSRSSSDSKSSSESSSDSEESEKESKKRKKKAKKLKKKQKKKEKERSEAESAEEKEQEELVTSTVRPEEIPPIPENRFLMRRSPQTVQKSKEEVEKDQRNKEERSRDSTGITYNSQSYHRRLVMTRSGRKIKGRGPRRYRTPSRSRSRSRDRFRRSETPPHWRQEMQRQRMRAVTGERWIKACQWDGPLKI
uniref:peptidylprolyl isomerase n=1 Tax=Amphiprion ocellaris TaxID=80972 RepID=A0AAQ6AA88_AMPOC